MNRFISLARAAVLASTLVGTTAAVADPMPLTSYLTSSDPLQNGRLSRNGIPQDFAGDEKYPGLNPSTVGQFYHYQAFTLNVGAANFISLAFDNSQSANTLNSFLAAYQTAYFVTSPQKSWLGDIGSAEYFVGDSGFMDFVAMPFSTVVLIVNAGSAGEAGIGAANPFTIYAQASTDAGSSNITDIPILVGGLVIPEPSTLVLLAPFALIVGLRTRRRETVTA